MMAAVCNQLDVFINQVNTNQQQQGQITPERANPANTISTTDQIINRLYIIEILDMLLYK
jgi:hypothetical protein